jgi:NAD(P)-dependent dehydrogenase (short-subunit alcohol dehydrogenase family)
MRFRDRLVLIAGGTGALGTAVVRGFVAEGARAIVTARSTPKSGTAMFGDVADRVSFVSADLADAGSHRVLENALEAAGRLDAVVNAVGAWEGGTPLVEENVGTLDRMIGLNLKPGYQLARATIPLMSRQGGGAFVEVASRAAIGAQPRQASYAATKSAAVSLFQSLSEEVRNAGVRVNIVSPTTMDTEANRRSMPKADRSTWVSTEDVARVILFLCSDDARAIHGAVIPVFGRG